MTIEQKIAETTKDAEAYKRYLLFSETDYYPSGGLGDVEEEFDTLDEAVAYLKDQESKHFEDLYQYICLFDCETRKVIWRKS